jgi:hypothetical protein
VERTIWNPLVCFGEVFGQLRSISVAEITAAESSDDPEDEPNET